MHKNSNIVEYEMILLQINNSGENVAMHFIYSVYQHGSRAKIIPMQIGEFYKHTDNIF